MAPEPPFLGTQCTQCQVWGRCGRGDAPHWGGLGGLPQETFEILRPNGYILGHFWSIWLLVLTVMIEALVTLKHVNLGVVLFSFFFLIIFFVLTTKNLNNFFKNSSAQHMEDTRVKRRYVFYFSDRKKKLLNFF